MKEAVHVTIAGVEEVHILRLELTLAGVSVWKTVGVYGDRADAIQAGSDYKDDGYCCQGAIIRAKSFEVCTWEVTACEQLDPEQLSGLHHPASKDRSTQ